MSIEDLDDEGRDLAEIVPDDAFNHPSCFDSSAYGQWEREIAQPYLEREGYRVLRWYSTDEDSFGPLVRAADVERDGEQTTFIYG